MHPDLDPRQGGLARLLRDLPDEAAPPYGYHEFERRALARVHGARSHAGARRLALAAVVLLGGLVVLLRLGAPSAVLSPGVGRAAASLAPGPDRDDAPPSARAVAAERWLASLPSEPAVVRVGTRAAVMGLEDHIAQVDDLLTAARGAGNETGRVRALQEERARLVGTLVQVRYAQTLANASP